MPLEIRIEIKLKSMDIEKKQKESKLKSHDQTLLAKELEKLEKIFALHSKKLRTSVWFSSDYAPCDVLCRNENVFDYQSLSHQKLNFYSDQVRFFHELISKKTQYYP